ncbi:MAG: viral integrase [Nanoarchaeotal virus 1]|nr:MAG: viral integrase [Nanoarchaeotal virus 1]
MDRTPKHWVKFIGGRPPTFEELYQIIRSNLEEYFNLVKLPNPKRLHIKRLMYYALAYVQITNGLRASEAIYALKEFLTKGNKEFKMLAEKSNKERWVIILEPLASMGPILKIYLDTLKNINRGNYKEFLRYNMGINPHTLRYVFIRKAVKQIGAEDTMVLMGYATIKHLMEYYRVIRSAEKLKEFINRIINNE